jgi:hypothetical protein
LGIIAVTLLATVGTVMAKGGFDEFGYNYQARVFVGTGGSWCAAKGLGWTCAGTDWEPYANDKLVMKWNAEWDRGNAENWVYPPYAAWVDNEWNGAVPGGSGEVWHYKIIWVGPELEDSPCWREGGYPIWGQFEVIMDQGTADGVHTWFAHAIPTGYGAQTG